MTWVAGTRGNDRALLEEARALAERSGDLWVQGEANRKLSQLHAFARDFGPARALLERAVEQLSKLDDQPGAEATALVDLSALTITVGLLLVCSWPRHRAVVWLLAPYLAWVLYAKSLNVGILLLNPA